MTAFALELTPRGDPVAFDATAIGANRFTVGAGPAQLTEPLESLLLAHPIDVAELEVPRSAGNEEMLCHDQCQ